MGLEFFSMLKSMKDIDAEYGNNEELKRMRQSYIVHLLDVILTERSIVAENDKEIVAQEKAENSEVGLDNVFELAGESVSDTDSETSVNPNVHNFKSTELVSVATPATVSNEHRD